MLRGKPFFGCYLETQYARICLVTLSLSRFGALSELLLFRLRSLYLLVILSGLILKLIKALIFGSFTRKPGLDDVIQVRLRGRRSVSFSPISVGVFGRSCFFCGRVGLCRTAG